MNKTPLVCKPPPYRLVELFVCKNCSEEFRLSSASWKEDSLVLWTKRSVWKLLSWPWVSDFSLSVSSIQTSP